MIGILVGMFTNFKSVKKSDSDIEIPPSFVEEMAKELFLHISQEPILEGSDCEWDNLTRKQRKALKTASSALIDGVTGYVREELALQLERVTVSTKFGDHINRGIRYSIKHIRGEV